MFTNIHQLPIRFILAITSLSIISTAALAGTITIPNNFSSGTPAVAAEVNANFSATKTAVDDNDSRIAILETTITTLQATITSLQSSLQNVQSNSVLALDGMLVATTDTNGYATAQFVGVNVQVVNGVNQTTINGLGNLIVGYNNARLTGLLACSDGQYNNLVDCEGAGETWSTNLKSGSHNLVAGDENSYSQTGGIVFGFRNTVSQTNASVSGGSANVARGLYSSVSGGRNNNVSGTESSISGGRGGSVLGNTSSISGGSLNTILGGADNSISGGAGAGDGFGNTAVLGGFNDWAAGSLFED